MIDALGGSGSPRSRLIVYWFATSGTHASQVLLPFFVNIHLGTKD